MKTITRLWIMIAVLAVLTPVGLALPEYFKAGAAWGEWGAEEIMELVGYVPAGLMKLSSFWSAPIPDYAFKGWEDKALPAISFSYIISALAGAAATIGAIILIGKVLGKKE